MNITRYFIILRQADFAQPSTVKTQTNGNEEIDYVIRVDLSSELEVIDCVKSTQIY